METRKFFSSEALNLSLLRAFRDFGNRITYDHNIKDWVKSIIIHGDDFEEIHINEKSDCGLLRGITIFWEKGLIELHYIYRDNQESITEYLPLDGIYQLQFKTKIKPSETDHHG